MSSTSVRVKTKRHRAHRRYVVVFYICFAALAIALIAATRIATPWFDGSPKTEPQLPGSSAVHIGTIAEQIGDEKCALAKFDNDTGHVTNATGCKSTALLDAHGVPVPMGTVHRLESISKSFSGTSH
jgi:hypothetical protein